MTARNGLFVTGATGFVGTALLAALTGRNLAVVAATRRPAALRDGVTPFRIGDLGPSVAWTPGLARCDVVVHLAARVHVMADHTADPLAEYRTANVAGTAALAEQAAAAGVRRFVYVSSIKVNGESTPRGRPFTADDPAAPIDPYGISKAEAEEVLRAIGRRTGMETVVIRPPLIYGPGVRANFLSMVRWIARGVPLPLGALRDNRRSLAGIDNLVDLILCCVDHPSAANEIFLVSDDEDLSTTDLLRRTASALGVRPRLIPVPGAMLETTAAVVRRGAMMQRLSGSLQVDITKTRRMLDWTPPFDVDEELRRTVAPLRRSVVA